MKRAVILLVFSLICTCALNAQTKINVNLYETTKDYVEKSYSSTDVTLLAKEVRKDCILIKKFVDTQTGKKIKTAIYTWAIEYNGEVYFNLKNSTDLNNWKLFIKFDVEGPNYCMTFIDKHTSNLIKNSGANYGGGLEGALISESNKWDKNWVNEDGEKVKIFMVNLNKQVYSGNGKTSSAGNFLKRKELKSLFKLNKSISEIRKLTFEEVLQIIEKENQ